MGPIQVVVQDGNNLVLEVTPTPSTTVILDRGIAGPAGPAGPGDVNGPASATDNAVARFDGTTGKLIQNSVVTIGDTGNMAGVGTLAVTDLTDSSLTAGRVTYAGTGGNLVDSANMTFNGTDLTVSGAVNAGSINATTLDLTNLEVTNIKAKDGTASITLADSTGVASFSANPVISAGTANGVAYLNGSKVLTTGSALTFDGTNLGVGRTATSGFKVDIQGDGGMRLLDASALRQLTLTPANAADDPSIISASSAAGLSIRAANASGNIIFTANGSTEAMRLTSSLLSVVPGATIQGITVGRGAGAVSSNTAVGVNALAANTTGNQNVAVGLSALQFNTTGTTSAAVGLFALRSNTTGSNNTAMGQEALWQNTTANNNTAVGYQAGYSNTTGGQNTFVGHQVGFANTTGTNNSAFGAVTVGFAGSTLASNTTGVQNNAFGASALTANTTGGENSAFGFLALLSNTTASYNSAFGNRAMQSNTTGANNTAHGYQALFANTTASNNTAVGYQAGYSTTAANGTYVGYRAGANYTITTGGAGPFSFNTMVGAYAGQAATTGRGNTLIGYAAGSQLTTGSANTFVGADDTSTGAGDLITTGSKNTIIGRYNGNQGGLDIRTASNYIVLSDGDGNPRLISDGSGRIGINQPTPLARLDIKGDTTTFGGMAKIYLTDSNSVSFSRNWSIGNGGADYGVLTFAVSATKDGNPGDGAGFNCLVLARTGAVALRDATVSADGTGITFPGTQNASSNANTLDDYEEGTWTPVIFGSTTAGTGTYSAQDGTYTKVGRSVTVVGFIWVTAHTGTGVMFMSGLPFTSTQATTVSMSETGNLTLAANNVPQMIVVPVSTNIVFAQTPVGGGTDSAVSIDTAFYTRFACTYFV